MRHGSQQLLHSRLRQVVHLWRRARKSKDEQSTSQHCKVPIACHTAAIFPATHMLHMPYSSCPYSHPQPPTSPSTVNSVGTPVLKEVLLRSTCSGGHRPWGAVGQTTPGLGSLHCNGLQVGGEWFTMFKFQVAHDYWCPNTVIAAGDQ